METTHEESYEVFVSKDYFKFNAAHFMAYPGFRERLHGHNYRIAVRVTGALRSDGYVVDFGDIKKGARAICEEIDERTIVPLESDCLEIKQERRLPRVATAAPLALLAMAAFAPRRAERPRRAQGRIRKRSQLRVRES